MAQHRMHVFSEPHVSTAIWLTQLRWVAVAGQLLTDVPEDYGGGGGTFVVAVTAGAVSFRYRDGTQKNGVPVADAIAEILAAIRDRVQV